MKWTKYRYIYIISSQYINKLIHQQQKSHVFDYFRLLQYLTRRVWRYQKGVIRIRKSKDRQHNGQKKNDKRTNKGNTKITELRTTMYKQRRTKQTHKTTVREKRTQLNTGVNSGAIEESAVSAPLVAPVVLI